MKIYVLVLLIAITVALPLASVIEEVKDNNIKDEKSPIYNWNLNQNKSKSLESKSYKDVRRGFEERIACLFSRYENNLCIMFCMYREGTKGKCENKHCKCFKK